MIFTKVAYETLQKENNKQGRTRIFDVSRRSSLQNWLLLVIVHCAFSYYVSSLGRFPGKEKPLCEYGISAMGFMFLQSEF